jgi:hypothetical protein
MREAAIVVVAAGFLKVLTSGCIMRRRVVGKRARVTPRTVAFEEPALADCLLVGIMAVPTTMPSTYTCATVRHM